MCWAWFQHDWYPRSPSFCPITPWISRICALLMIFRFAFHALAEKAGFYLASSMEMKGTSSTRNLGVGPLPRPATARTARLLLVRLPPRRAIRAVVTHRAAKAERHAGYPSP